jgi:hypothetical protein
VVLVAVLGIGGKIAGTGSTSVAEVVDPCPLQYTIPIKRKNQKQKRDHFIVFLYARFENEKQNTENGRQIIL